MAVVWFLLGIVCTFAEPSTASDVQPIMAQPFATSRISHQSPCLAVAQVANPCVQPAPCSPCGVQPSPNYQPNFTVPVPIPGLTPTPTHMVVTGGLRRSTCSIIGHQFPGIHRFLMAEVPRQKPFAKGAYACLAAWTEVTGEPTAWIRCKFGSLMFAAEVIKNGPFIRLHRNTDPNAALTPVFKSGNSAMDRLLNSYYLRKAQRVGAAWIPGIPRQMQPVASKPETHRRYRRLKVSQSGYVPLTAQQLAAMPTLPQPTKEQLAMYPGEWDVRTGRRCQAFHRNNQGTCGSCWAWATAATYSAKLCMITDGKVDVEISEGSLLDCSKLHGYYSRPTHKAHLGFILDPATGSHNNMCYGGNFVSAITAMRAKKGVVSKACSPYNGRWTARQCGRVASSCRKFGMGTDKNVYAIKNDLWSIRAALYQYGPASVRIDSNLRFHKYKCGIYKHCRNGYGWHAMSLFGYGSGYWVVANSWGDAWGEKGYGRIVAGRNCMGMEDKGAITTIILDAASFQFCRGAPPCQNGGNFDANCRCACTGFWKGPTCSKCEAYCAHGGTVEQSTCSCTCPAGYFGKECDRSITWKWTDQNTVRISWSLVGEDWKGKARIAQATANGAVYRNGINGVKFYTTSSREGSMTVGQKYGQGPMFFTFEEWLGRNEFGGDKGWLVRKLRVSKYASPTPAGHASTISCMNMLGDRQCTKWKAHCTNAHYSSYMKKHCTKSCAACPQAPNFGGHISCVNKLPDAQCAKYSEHCHHTSPYYTTMLQHCPKSCGACVAAPQSAVCKNNQSDASCYRYRRHCARSSPYYNSMVHHCAKTCGYC